MIRKAKPKQKPILSEKIAKSLTVAPSADIEDDLVFHSKPTTVTKDDFELDDDEEETVISSFRKQNVKLLSDIDNKYAGEVSKRKSSESDQSIDDKSDQNESEIQQDSEDLSFHSEDDDDTEGQSDDDGDELGDYDESETEGFDLSQLDTSEHDGFKHLTETNKSEEIGKGNCVRNQLKLWENLLETRINMQKCLIAANKMPMPDTFKDLKKENDTKFISAINKTKNTVTNLLNRLLDLQSHLLVQYPETKNLSQNKQNTTTEEDDDDEEIPSDSDIESNEPVKTVEKIRSKKRKLEDLSKEMQDRFLSYCKYRNGVIQKWHDKTRLAVGFKKNQSETSTISQIEFILGDKNRLIKRTQMKRSKYDIVGVKKDDDSIDEGEDIGKERNIQSLADKGEEYCSEIFDDDDFYHQLLRELIEHKSADVSDPIQLSRQWIALQQLRSKMKRKIDTRATKGRRIRYAVHTKLVNFMAPEKSSNCSDDMKNELFASLFGKQYENGTST